MEDMRNAVTSTPAVEPLELEYEETTTECQILVLGISALVYTYMMLI